MRNRFTAADGARVAPCQRYLRRREQWLHKPPWFGGNLLSLAELGRRDEEGASRGKMAPQAVAEPALPVLPCRISKHPTRLTHQAPVSLPPTVPATPSVSLSFSTDTSASSHSLPPAWRCLCSHPLTAALLPQGARRHPKLPDRSPSSLGVLLPSPWKRHPNSPVICQTPLAPHQHPPWWHLRL